MEKTSLVLLSTLWSGVFLATPAMLSGLTLEAPAYTTLPSLSISTTTVAHTLPYEALAATLATSSPMAQTPIAVKEPTTPMSEKKTVRHTAASRVLPVELRIPAARIDAPIEGVGINEKGEVDVPSGSSPNVGWYTQGPMPGENGSAIIDAHVFAAFAHLKDVGAGDDIFVDMSDGSVRHFVVSAALTFRLATLSPSQLFRKTSRADLNLITCAGSLTSDKSTYDHRLIVYSTLVRG